MRCNLLLYHLQSDLQPTGKCKYDTLRGEVQGEGILPKVVWKGHLRLATLMFHGDIYQYWMKSSLNDYKYLIIISIIIYMWFNLITYIFLTVWYLMILGEMSLSIFFR